MEHLLDYPAIRVLIGLMLFVAIVLLAVLIPTRGLSIETNENYDSFSESGNKLYAVAPKQRIKNRWLRALAGIIGDVLLWLFNLIYKIASTFWYHIRTMGASLLFFFK